MRNKACRIVWEQTRRWRSRSAGPQLQRQRLRQGRRHDYPPTAGRPLPR